MKKCDCYHESKKVIFWPPDEAPMTVNTGSCWGTRERDECSCDGDRTKCDFYPEVRAKALQEIEPKFGEWISVKDRLPKEHDKYLCAEWSKTFNKYFVSVLWFSKDLYKHDKYSFPDKKGVGGFYESSGEWGMVLMDEVTHWMPLPKPPKGE